MVCRPRHQALASVARLVVLASVALIPDTVQSAEELTEIHFREELRRLVPVAGEVLVGVVSGQANQSINPNSLYLRLVSSTARSLCVDVISRDATYFASIVYDIAGTTPGIYKLRFPTSYGSQLASFKIFELGLLASTKTDCSSGRQPDRIFPVYWTSNPQPTAPLAVLVNAGTSDAVLRVATDTGIRDHSCRDASGALRRTAYDKECVVNSLAGLKLNTAEIVRSSFGVRFPIVPVPIVLP
jgi:hypothetical protein